MSRVQSHHTLQHNHAVRVSNSTGDCCHCECGWTDPGSFSSCSPFCKTVSLLCFAKYPPPPTHTHTKATEQTNMVLHSSLILLTHPHTLACYWDVKQPTNNNHTSTLMLSHVLFESFLSCLLCACLMTHILHLLAPGPFTFVLHALSCLSTAWLCMSLEPQIQWRLIDLRILHPRHKRNKNA